MTTKTTIMDLLNTVLGNFECFHDDKNNNYITLKVNDHFETWDITSNNLKEWLVFRFFEVFNTTPDNSLIRDSINLFNALAKFKGGEKTVYTRIGFYEDKIYIDLANDKWETVEIRSNGWSIIRNSPVKFNKSKIIKSLPTPIDGSIEVLKPLINFSNDTQFYLLIGWLLGALYPYGPFPILVLEGGQGTAKSTASRIVKSTIDPSTSSLRSVPTCIDDLMISTLNSWVIPFDNLSGLSNWFSDSLCRLSTGGGLVRRKKYSNQTETVFEAKRPIIINGIDNTISLRHDLADRAILINFDYIDEGNRKTEAEIFNGFKKIHPNILGALCSALSCSLKNFNNINVDNLQRMADFTKWVEAASPALEWTPGTFIDAYRNNRNEIIDITTDFDILSHTIINLVETMANIEKTPTDLLNMLDEIVPDKLKNKNWPNGANILSRKLKRSSVFLRSKGVSVMHKKGAKGKRTISISKIKNTATSATLPN